MSKFITTEEQIKNLLPNQIITVKGESNLLDKLLPYIDISERWAVDNFLGEELYERLGSDMPYIKIFDLASSMVVADAMIHAVPVLDVVITPNGFATVGTQNLVAASKARVDKLIDAMVEVRDSLIEQLLRLLPTITDWYHTTQAAFFSSTLFPGFEILQRLNISTNRWNQYLKLRSDIIGLESTLADEFVSDNLLNALHYEVLTDKINGNNLRKVVVSQLKNQIVHRLSLGSYDFRKLNNIVNFIRINPDAFPEWHDSEVAVLFNPPVFKNKKSSAGYFF